MDTAFWVAGIAMEAAFIVLLLYRRVFRMFPVFCSYVLWAFCSDVVMLLIKSRYPGHYFQTYLVEATVDSMLQFGVLVELAWSILRPVRNALPRGAIVVVAVLVIIAGAMVWPFAGMSELPRITPEYLLLMRLQQTVSILRVVFFLVMAACSQVLALGWRNRELQVATGLGFYSLVSLGAEMLHVHQTAASKYHHVDQLVAASYLLSLLYWGVSFAQNEAPRQEFSPKMQSLLLTVAGAARSNRVALSETTVGSVDKRPKI
jgi:hypothetical protein